jgi:serine/threonine-protein kinase
VATIANAVSGSRMLDPKESRFWKSTALSGLMDVQGLTACWNAIPPGKRDDPQHIDRRLARQAVQTQALTLWQAQQLIAGRITGFKVDRYTLLDLIGQGGMGRVYLAQDTRLNRKVALKILSPERVNNPRAIARFQREARVGAQLQHENLVRIYDFGESSGRYYLVMEYIEGKTIGTLISEQGGIVPSTAVKLTRQVALGLEHAHRKGLIHRDVNPYNILVTRDGIAKLADLGLAIDLAEDDRVTREGATVGTFDYVAPEQARHSHSADIRSDIYSLGCTLYHMCAGQVPFPTPSLPEKLFAHQAMDAPPLAEVVPGLAPGLSEVVQRMMRKLPDERYATPLQVAQALEPFEEVCDVLNGRDDGQRVIPEAVATTAAAPAVKANIALLEPGMERSPASLAVVESTRSKTSLAPSIDHNAERALPVPSTVRSPVSATDSDPEFALDLILAPEPSLTAGRSRPKTSPGSSHSRIWSEGNPLLRLSRYGLWGLLAITMIVLATVVVLALVNPFANTAAVPKKDPRPGKQTKEAKDAENSPAATDKALTTETAAQDSTAPIVVRLGSEESGQPFAADKLLDAISSAMGGHGWVELRNTKPLKITSTVATPLNLLSASGSLSISAAEGVQPVIEVDLKGAKPLLEIGSAVNLKLSGITILVHYPQAEPGTVTIPPAVITTAGSSKIERCAFKVASGSRSRGCRAIYSNLGALEIERSWFEGFDKAIDVAATAATHVRISQTMIVPGPVQNASQDQAGEEYGWGVRIVFAGSARPETQTSPANVLLTHCTVDGAGLFDLTDSRGPGRVWVDVRQCAVRANTLLALRQDPPLKDQIHWQGEANQYDILGRSWVVHSASQGTPAFTEAATDLESWLHTASDEKHPVRSKLKYQIDPSARSESLQPRDFAIEPQTQPQSHPGADPELVGPWSRP